MNKKEISEALKIAKSDQSLENVDHEVLSGLYKKDFKKVTTTILVVAKMVRDLAVFFDGQVDSVALDEFEKHARHKISIV